LSSFEAITLLAIREVVRAEVQLYKALWVSKVES